MDRPRPAAPIRFRRLPVVVRSLAPLHHAPETAIQERCGASCSRVPDARLHTRP